MSYTKQQLLSIIDEAARAEGVNPNHLKIVAGIESSYQAGIIGKPTRSGTAKGLFQFTDATAKGYGVADPLDPRQAAQGAARYWKDLSRQFNGDLASMIAQYNGGNAGSKAVKSGKVFAETAAYMDKFNAEARKLGLADRIDTTRFSVANAPKRQPLAKSFVEGSRDIRAPQGPTVTDDVTAQLKQDLVDDEKSFMDKARDFGSAFSAGFKSSNLAVQSFQLVTQDSDPAVDEAWRTEATVDNLIKRLEEAKIDRSQWEYVLEGADSSVGFSNRIERVRTAQREQEAMAGSLGGAITGALAGGVLDPTFWLSGGAGAIAAAGRVGRAAKVAVGAAAGAATDAGLTATIGETVDPRLDASDVVINGLAGALGGGLGAIARGRLDARIDTPDGPELGDLDLPGGEPPSFPEPERPVPPPAPPEGPDLPPMQPRPPEEQPPVDFPDEPQAFPEAPKEPEGGEPLLPPDLPPGGAPEAPPEPPALRDKAWAEEWDEPVRIDAYGRGGEQGDTLLIPPGLAPKDRFRYVLEHGNEREKRITKFLQKNMQGLELVIRDLDTSTLNFVGKSGDTKAGVRFADQFSSPSNDVRYAIAKPAAGAWAYRAQLDSSRGKFIGLQTQKLRSGMGGRKGVSTENFLHETVHSITSRAVAFSTRAKGRTDLTPAQQRIVAAYKELANTFSAVRSNTGAVDSLAREAYGFTDTDEFLAEIASVPFEKALARVARDSGSPQQAVWKRLVKGMRTFASKLLGKGRDANDLLDSYYGAAARFIEEANEFRKAEIADPQNAPLLSMDDVPNMNTVGEIPRDPETLEEITVSTVFGTTWGKAAGGFAIENIAFNAKVPASVRAVFARLLSPTAGYKNGEVAGRSAWDDTVSLRTRTNSAYRREAVQAFEDWFKGQRGQGKYGWGVWAKEQARTEFNELMYDVAAGVKESTDPNVARALKAGQANYSNWIDLINNPGKEDGRTIKGLTMQKVVNEETGEITFVGALEKDPDYVPFRLSVNKLNEAVARYGMDKVQNLLKEAFYDSRPELRELRDLGEGKDYGGMFAKWYLSQVLDSKVNRKFDYLHSLETSTSGDEIVESMINGGVSPEDARKIVDQLLEKNKGTKAFSSSLRRRSQYNRKFSMTMEDGSRLAVYDLVDKDYGKLLEGYNNRMAGAVALAQNFEGVNSYEDITKLLYESMRREFGKGQLTDSQVAELRGAADSALSHILARPLDEPSNVKMGLSLLRDVNVATRMGGAVLYQLQEVAQLVGTLGIRNVLRAVPELRGSILRGKNGRLSSAELNDYEDLLGDAGHQILDYMDLRSGDEWSSLNGFGKGAQTLDAIQFGARKAAGGLLKYTGMTGAMVIEKRLALIALTRHFQDAANGKKLRYGPKRLATMGLSPADTASVLAAIKKYTPEGKRQLDVKAFAAGDPQAFAKWRVALQRELRRVVQENDIGAHIPAMDNGWFKSFTQFRSFVLQALNKSLLYGVNHADAQTAATVMYGIFFSMLTQTARAQIKAAGMSDEERKKYLDKAMDFDAPGGLLLRSVASISQASILPQVFDTISPFGNLFDGYRSTTDASTLWANPTADLVTGLVSTAKQAAYTATGQDTFDQRDAQQALKLVPFNNALGVSTVMGIMTRQLPKSTKAELLFDSSDEE